MRRQSPRNLDRLVAISDIDVDLGSADELFPGEELVVGQHLAVARGLGDL